MDALCVFPLMDGVVLVVMVIYGDGLTCFGLEFASNLESKSKVALNLEVAAIMRR